MMVPAEDLPSSPHGKDTANNLPTPARAIDRVQDHTLSYIIGLLKQSLLDRPLDSPTDRNTPEIGISIAALRDIATVSSTWRKAATPHIWKAVRVPQLTEEATPWRGRKMIGGAHGHQIRRLVGQIASAPNAWLAIRCVRCPPFMDSTELLCNEAHPILSQLQSLQFEYPEKLSRAKTELTSAADVSEFYDSLELPDLPRLRSLRLDLGSAWGSNLLKFIPRATMITTLDLRWITEPNPDSTIAHKLPELPYLERLTIFLSEDTIDLVLRMCQLGPAINQLCLLGGQICREQKPKLASVLTTCERLSIFEWFQEGYTGFDDAEALQTWREILASGAGLENVVQMGLPLEELGYFECHGSTALNPDMPLPEAPSLEHLYVKLLSAREIIHLKEKGTSGIRPRFREALRLWPKLTRVTVTKHDIATHQRLQVDEANDTYILFRESHHGNNSFIHAQCFAPDGIHDYPDGLDSDFDVIDDGDRKELYELLVDDGGILHATDLQGQAVSYRSLDRALEAQGGRWEEPSREIRLTKKQWQVLDGRKEDKNAANQNQASHDPSRAGATTYVFPAYPFFDRSLWVLDKNESLRAYVTRKKNEAGHYGPGAELAATRWAVDAFFWEAGAAHRSS